MSLKLLLALLIGTVLMFGVMLLCRIRIKMSVSKTLLFSVLLMVTGLLSTKIMAFIESGSIKGQSFFGAVFFLPLLLLPVAKLIREDRRTVLDLSAPAVCAMLAVMKVSCYLSGCCAGKILYTYYKQNDNTLYTCRFPSQLVELANAVFLLLILLLLLSNSKRAGALYPAFMVLYGVTRFILNLFRETTPFLFGLPAGNFWSIISVVIGAVWLILWSRAVKKQRIFGG